MVVRVAPRGRLPQLAHGCISKAKAPASPVTPGQAEGGRYNGKRREWSTQEGDDFFGGAGHGAGRAEFFADFG
jgi:hypothetical protein